MALVSARAPGPPRPGASNPLIITPLTGSGGYVQGTEIETTWSPASLRIRQKVGIFR